MFVTRLKLKNWRNFREVDVPLRETTYLLGPNASGKSNLLDVFRFLRDVSKPSGGGLQQAVATRGGIAKLRCLHARKDPEVRIEVELSEQIDASEPRWRYVLGFKPERKGLHNLLVSTEEVWDGSAQLISRPDEHDEADARRLTQTHLEQINVNAQFRAIADFFGRVTYLHLVPQLLKYGDRIGGNRLEDDPFGQGFLERIAKSSRKTREARLRKIEKALSLAVPQLRELKFESDPATGRPHLKARYEHYRPNAGWQQEEDFSDGTLRLIGLLWALLEGESLLLLEEPELSLNTAIVEQIPLLVNRIQRQAKGQQQVLISTHSEALLSNQGIDARSVLLLEPAHEGSEVRPITREEAISLGTGLTVAEVLLPKTRPQGIEQLALF